MALVHSVAATVRLVMMVTMSLTISGTLADNGWFSIGDNAWGFWYCDFKLDMANVALVETLQTDSAARCVTSCFETKSLKCTHLTYDTDTKTCYLIQAKNPNTIQFRPYYEVGHVAICGFIGKYISKNILVK